MEENSTSAVMKACNRSDQNILPRIAEILNESATIISQLPKPISWRALLQKTDNAEIFAILSNDQLLPIGAVVVEKIDRLNRRAALNIAFDPKWTAPQIASEAIKCLKKQCYQEWRLSKISIEVADNQKSLIEALMNNGFMEEAVLQAENIGIDGGFENSIRFSATNNGRPMAPPSINANSPEQERMADELKARIETLETALEAEERDRKKKNETLENLTREKQEAQEKIALLEAELKGQTDKHIAESFGLTKNQLLVLKTVGKLTEEKPAERESDFLAEKKPAKSLADRELTPRRLEILKTIIESDLTGITQQEIIKKTGITQANVSMAVRILTAKGLILNKEEGIRSRAIAIMEEIKNQFPDLLQPKTATIADSAQTQIALSEKLIDSEIPEQAQKPLKQPVISIEEICNSNGFGQTQREILLALKEAGGILNAGGLRNKIGVSGELFKSYLIDMQSHKIIRFKNNLVKLTI